MGLIVRNDEQIKVGTTPGLIAGSSSFTFDGTGGKPDYRQTDIVISEINGRSPMVRNLDFSWNLTTGTFVLLLDGDMFKDGQYYNVHFQPVTGPTTSIDGLLFINPTYFIRDINLVNLNQLYVLDRLNSFIARYEPECLTDLLGYALYKVLLTEDSERITNLIFGVEYAIPTSMYVQKWQGIIHDDKLSLIAHYIYFYFQSDTMLITTGTGTKASKQEGGTAESPNDKMVKAHRFYASEARDMLFFLWNQVDLSGNRIYPEFTYDQYMYAKDLVRPGGVNFFGF